ncbi:MAG: UDP-3-O-(3-hydroxymyristoyl)glucosamine N-acyltransferase [Pseudomonadota bacterium]
MSECRSYSLAELAARFGGEVVGDGAVAVQRVATLESAGPADIAFFANAKYRSQLTSTRAGALIVGRAERDASALPRIVCDNPYAYFARISALLHPARPVAAGIHPGAVVAASAVIDASASVGALACIGERARIGARSVIGEGVCVGDDSMVGDDCRLYPRVTVYHGCTIGSRVIIHSGSVIGADGFGVAMEQERWLKIPQIGGVVIGDDVEIGANTTIDRGTLDDTVIGEGVKLDNQIQVAHNVHIGAHTAIAGCVGIAGSAKIGRHCRIGGGAIILGHLQIADHVDISAGTLIGKSIDKAGAYTAVYPFEAHQAWRRNAVHLRRLDRMAREIHELHKRTEK